jgi:transmembrane sensor
MTTYDDNPPDEAVPWTVLARYLAGDCDATDCATVAAWLAADHANILLLEELRAVWTAAGPAARAPDVEGILRRSKRGRPELRLATDAGPPRPLRITPIGTPVATGHRGRVVLVISALAATLVVGIWRSRPELSLWMSRPPGGPQRELVTGARQQLTVRFDDGTRVQLAPGSRLHYADPAATGATPRDVTLDGEAVFDVVHDPAHPFTVRAGGLVTRDVGTRFVVRAYSTDEQREVTVAEGAVAVSVRGWGAHRPLLLHRAEGVRADSMGRLAREVGVDTAAAFAWTAGRLVFASTPMRQVVLELERWYGVEVRVGDAALADRRLSATFTREPVTSVLASVAAAVDARVERSPDGRTTVFRSAP